MDKNKNQSGPALSRVEGFTLIEVLIYCLFVSFMIGSVIGAAYGIISGESSLNLKTITEEEANFALRKIEWALSGVSAINSPVSGASASVLSINKVGFAENPLTIDLSSSTLETKTSTGGPDNLTSGWVEASNLLFSHIAASGTAPEAVKAQFKMNGIQFQETVYLRK